MILTTALKQYFTHLIIFCSLMNKIISVLHFNINEKNYFLFLYKCIMLRIKLSKHYT